MDIVREEDRLWEILQRARKGGVDIQGTHPDMKDALFAVTMLEHRDDEEEFKLMARPHRPLLAWARNNTDDQIAYILKIHMKEDVS